MVTIVATHLPNAPHPFDPSNDTFHDNIPFEQERRIGKR
jgi:hypothetical protein